MINFTYKYKDVCGDLTVTDPETEQRIRDLYNRKDSAHLVEEVAGMILPQDKFSSGGKGYTTQDMATENQLADVCMSVNGHQYERLL